ncbi:sensor histidine kinase [Ferribacterium limneticum]|jgi:Na+/proline symporter/nitrogen-specific signal transduction histidine kinase|uniref:sensor histidine kinase n=1 Tax=Ferribacterium limneticum TaxID=76259 RepID=UPI001CFB270E|nr:sensor histidine kinase [Ferribacterium limneticum]UCV17984.1 histidine kinase [Ferribacterium limneticum]
MLSGWFVALLATAYLGLLFAVARFGDARADAGKSIISANVYALSLAVYCTSWTFYGSVGRATSGGLSFLTIYLGPTLMLLCVGVIIKMIRISKAQRITSIADFIASRYGKSQLLAGMVTVIAVIGVVPYIALQLKAMAASVDVLLEHSVSGVEVWGLDSTFLIAVVLAFFSILFGTRHLDATERHEGMVAAVAFESVVKLIAFMAVGLFVTYGMFGGLGDLFQRAAASADLGRLLQLDSGRAGTWTALIILSGLAIIFLPRQFQIIVVENVDESHLKRAVWLFPLYLLLINIFVLPLALGGLLHFDGQGVNPDTFVLTLPLARGAEALALLAFIGGLSAATGMVIVETIALSTMVCNDLVMPILLRSTGKFVEKRKDLSGLLIGIRRAAIALILLLGYIYFRAAGEAYALVGIGLISFAAVAQFAPAMFGGMYWKQGTRAGAVAGLLAGFVVWLYTLLLPSFAKSGWMPSGFVEHGLFGLGWLKAQALFGLAGLDEISHCLWWSMLANIGAYVAVSLNSKPDAVEASQAERFVDVFRFDSRNTEALLWRGKASPDALVQLLERFLGAARARQQLAAYASSRRAGHWRELPADADFVQFAESELAGAIGSASARVMVASVAQEEDLGLEEVLDILDEATQVRAYSHELEGKQRELEAATTELREANERLRELDRMKDDFISTVTHELRTPLTSIRALSEMLHEDPRLELTDRKRFLGIIVNEAERLTRLINQILDMAKMESGRAEWTTGEVDMGEVVRESMASLEQLFRDKDVALEGDIPTSAPVVQADRDRLTQVMINLLSNAVKFVPGGSGRVQVRLSSGAGLVRVEVRDNGPGLTAEECSVIFEKFRQGGNTMTDKPQGTGLGLPISRQIVEYFGGNLWVESAPGAGANFIFTVPLPAPDDNSGRQTA